MKYKAVLFDLDGTLMDTIVDLTDSVNYSLQKNGFPVHSLAEVKSFVGNGLHALIKRALPEEITKNQFDRCYSDMAQYYRAHSMDNSQPYNGVQKLLSDLSDLGIKTVIVTNKIQASADDIATRFFRKVNLVIGDDGKRPLKPAPDGVLGVMSQFQLEPHEVVLVGDSEVDMFTAQNAGIDAVAVLWGFRGKEFLSHHGAGCFADSCCALKQILIS